MLLLQTKLRNAVKRHGSDLDLEFRLHTVAVNGQKRGCSGFIRNARSGTIVYVDTEISCMPHLSYLYRFADSFQDYRGYRNRYGKTLEDYAEGICNCLRTTPQAMRDRRI